MEFRELLDIVHDEPVFETGLLLAGDADPRDIRRQLSRWKQSGNIYQLRRGLYSLAPPYQKVRPHPFLVANRMLPSSYVSLQSALAFYGLIPEHVPVTTSVTTSRPARWDTPLGIFDFRHIQIPFFGGFRLVELVDKQRAFIATPEKALLDLIYLEPAGDTLEYLTELRLSSLDRLDRLHLNHLVRNFGKPKLRRAAAVIQDLVEEEGNYESL
jgi:predicted transcriptional regulator of viral defense system